MKALLVGGTGTISTAISEQLLAGGHELFLLNRGNKNPSLPKGAHILQADVHDAETVETLLAGHKFDVVADFTVYDTEELERDFRLFRDKTSQYIFISTASAYQKPSVQPVITESTPLVNPYWLYSRKKADCEAALMEHFRRDGFPVTIVRPSHTYGKVSVPLALHGNNGPWQVLSRMLKGKPVPIHGDGSALWTVTHNSDFARGFIGLMGNPHAIGQAVHITSDERLTWNQIHEIVASELGVKLNAVYVPSVLLAHAGNAYGYDFRGALLGDKAVTVIFDNTKLKTLVPGFAATTRFDQGVSETIAHFLSHPHLQVEDPDYDSFCDKIAAVMDDAWKAVGE